MSEIQPIPEENGKKTGRCVPPAEHQFKPGNPGGGRPQGSVSLKTLLKSKLSETEGDRTNAQRLVDATFKEAEDKDGPSRRLVWEYVEGAPKQSMIVQGLERFERLGAVLARHNIPEDVALAIIEELTDADPA